jgi:serine/threonine protein kinase
VANVEITVDAEKREPDTTSHHSIQEAEPDSLAGCESETYGNRIHCCLVVSPAGQPLHAYRSVEELLKALRDTTQSHKSLLKDKKILHRDISENNIIITKAATKEDPKKMLIDLDLAKELDSLPSKASHQTGTIQFIAIEVLQGKITYTSKIASHFSMSSHKYAFAIATKMLGKLLAPHVSQRRKNVLASLSRFFRNKYYLISNLSIFEYFCL